MPPTKYGTVSDDDVEADVENQEQEHRKRWKIISPQKTDWRDTLLRPVRLLPAVFLGLLLNILDALSYGMILFPLGQPIFQDLGSDGIAMFYVSTIVAQLTYSLGGSVFKGGIGSEMIEVVPFFHKMAFTILHRVGEDDPTAVYATVILAFAISSVVTGAVFFLMGACKLGSLVGFFPRHILIGCIGGVGWFLVATAVEVSARLNGNLEYNLTTLRHLFQADTILLWTIPLALAIVLMFVQKFVKSKFLVGGYFIAVAAIFYFFKFALNIQFDTLHSNGWVFDSPPAGNPWYHFYTLYNFKAVHWGALGETIPAMFALTFFGILHVPINVPALGISTGEDNLNVDRELIAHGVSNALSGCIGSIQNYLVYTNSILFIASGGNDRLAGVMLAGATFGILLAGPVIIGYIPVMVVGALIYLLGIELLQEALVDPYGKLQPLEYATIIIIVVTMGAWDFVIGILVGIILALLDFVVQTSQTSAIRATHSGIIANSTVRRPNMQQKFLKEAGQQIFVMKLGGQLFFGTIVGVENRIRALLDEDAFQARPIRYLVLDMAHIIGVDFSAAEAFKRINRLLKKRGVTMCIAGQNPDGKISRSLRKAGLFGTDDEVHVFDDLNKALEYCENTLLYTLQRQQEHIKTRRSSSLLEVPKKNSMSSSYPAEFMFSSPRRSHLSQITETIMEEHAATHSGMWSGVKQPLPLLLQMFENLSEQKEDFWYPAAQYFSRCTFVSGTTIYYQGESASAFYLLEEGVLRAEYELPQGNYSELIIAGQPCGELPFFSQTDRTASMTAEKDCIAWQLTEAKWADLQKEQPDIARELLKVCLKLTKERMDVITAYFFTTSG
jgi:SulP family sulfate permease